MIYGEHKLFIRFNVIIETQRLSVFTLNPIRTERLRLMKSLSDKGLNSKQISDYLNFKGYKTPKGHLYYPKLVWVTLKKYQRRLDRLQSSTKIISVSEKLYLRPLKKYLKDKVFFTLSKELERAKRSVKEIDFQRSAD